ncbi:MAG TPA: 4-hydroxy-tetrahydrodipicolinate synthase [Xanthomonadaceae bacterium]|nr:4-hydroxy-tetrahydrodipicolinate synthase [Xanthomonadaceae bacterium]
MPAAVFLGFQPLQLAGSITALVTPFRADGSVDADAWCRLLESQVTAGSQALVVAGSTGEAAALEPDEFQALIRRAVDTVAGRVPVLAGTGMPATAKTVRQTRLAAEAGADAALVVAPAYVRPTQDGMFRHFSEVARHGGLPVVLYNVPSRTACDLLPETVARLREDPRVIGIKEARAEPGRMDALLALAHDGFTVLSGDDPTAARSMLAGAHGCISVASNVVPRRFRALCDAARAGQAEAAGALGRELAPVFDFLGIEPNPIPVKALLAGLGAIVDHLRLPLTPLSPAHREQSRALCARITELEAA